MKHVNFDLFVSGEKCGLNMSINRESIIAACGYVPSELIVAYYEDGIFYEDSTKGVELQGASNKVYVDSSAGNMYVYDESTSQYKPVGGMTAEDKEILNSISTPASATKAGVIKVGEGLSIDSDGILKVVGEGGTNYQDLVNLVVPKVTISGLKYPTILDDNNYTVTFTCGDKVVKKRTNGEDTMKIDAPKLGTWTASCIPDRRNTYTASVNVAALGNSYSMSMSMNIYDIQRISVPELSSKQSDGAATTVGDYALFGGLSTVDAYSPDLVKTSAPELSTDYNYLAATTVGDYALFGGGYSYGTVDAYSPDLVKTSAPNLSQKRYYLSATTVGCYALFGGGYYSASGGTNHYSYSTVDAYTSDLVKTSAPNLSQKRYNLAATTVGGRALFGGGYYRTNNDKTAYSTVDAYTSDLVKTSAPNLSSAKEGLAATTIGEYALFGGISTVDAYTSDLVKTSAPDLSQKRYNLAATTVGGYALFGGGYYSTGSSSSNTHSYDTVDAYTSDLVKKSAMTLGNTLFCLSATTNGNYALFGCGSYYGAYGKSPTDYVCALTPIDLLPPTE